MLLSEIRNQQVSGLGSADTEGIRELSARLAANPLLVQASTGNTSLKTGDTLWIKASGKWLADAASPDFLIPVALRRARACLNAGEAIPETEKTDGVCASIETAMHTVLPHKVVVHVHSVNAIAWAVQTNAPNALRGCLDGLSWQWIPYTFSGTPLAQRVEAAHRCNPNTNVFVLGNHGLVVCGESCDSAERLLEEVEKRLDVEPRPLVASSKVTSPGPEGEKDRGSPGPACIHQVARDDLSRAILRGGVLYPCQALFLPFTVFAGERPLSAETGCLPKYTEHRRASMLLGGDRGVASTPMTESQHELLFGLTQVLRRIYQPSAVRYLSCGEVGEVLRNGGQYLACANQRSDQDGSSVHTPSLA